MDNSQRPDYRQVSIRLPEAIRRKIRWLMFLDGRSQQAILEEIIEKALAGVEPPAAESS